MQHVQKEEPASRRDVPVHNAHQAAENQDLQVVLIHAGAGQEPAYRTCKAPEHRKYQQFAQDQAGLAPAEELYACAKCLTVVCQSTYKYSKHSRRQGEGIVAM